MAEAAALSRTEVRGGSGSGSEARGEGRGARGGRMFVLGFLCGATAMLEGRSRGGFLGPGGVAGEAGPGAGHLRPRPPAPRWSWSAVHVPIEADPRLGPAELVLLRGKDLGHGHGHGPLGGHYIAVRDAWFAAMWGRDGNHICPDLARLREDAGGDGPVLYSVYYDSEGLFENANVGQGNWITAFYAMRLQALQVGADLEISCRDAEDRRTEHILPWLNGYFPARYGHGPGATTDAGGGSPPFPFPYPHPPSKKEPSLHWGLCEPPNYELAEMAPFVRYDMRRMAIAVAGIPHPGHPIEAWAEQHLWGVSPPSYSGPPDQDDVMQLPDPRRGDPPLVPGIEVDDAAIHFRCEDLMGSHHPSFGFMKFAAYGDIIRPDVRSIGVVTNPFDDAAQNRGGAGSRADVKLACRTVTYALRDFLEDRFPSARVRLRNGRNETVVTSFARLILANQTIVGISSFGIWTAISSLGTGHIRRPDYPKAPNEWSPPLQDMYDDIELFDAPKVLPAAVATRMKDGQMDELLEWFRNETFDFR